MKVKEYKVWNQGSEVTPGTKLVSFRGDEYVFVTCKHPRKIIVKKLVYGFKKELYPSVFAVIIKEQK